MSRKPSWECFDGGRHDWQVYRQHEVYCDKCYRCLSVEKMLAAFKREEDLNVKQATPMKIIIVLSPFGKYRHATDAADPKSPPEEARTLCGKLCDFWPVDANSIADGMGPSCLVCKKALASRRPK